MNPHQDFWDKKYSGNSEYKQINKPSDFIKFVYQYFPKNGQILELGAGTGQDTEYLLQKGFHVTATDFSPIALHNLKKKFEDSDNLTVKEINLTKQFPEPDGQYDAVLANLVIHYFNSETTQQIYNEIYRVLKPRGILAVMVNTKKDPEFNLGKKLEEDFFELKTGRPKRYFSIDTLQFFTKQFQKIFLDDKGIDSRRTGKQNLIRFIGKKYVNRHSCAFILGKF